MLSHEAASGGRNGRGALSARARVARTASARRLCEARRAGGQPAAAQPSVRAARDRCGAVALFSLVALMSPGPARAAARRTPCVRTRLPLREHLRAQSDRETRSSQARAQRASRGEPAPGADCVASAYPLRPTARRATACGAVRGRKRARARLRPWRSPRVGCARARAARGAASRACASDGRHERVQLCGDGRQAVRGDALVRGQLHRCATRASA